MEYSAQSRTVTYEDNTSASGQLRYTLYVTSRDL